MWASSKVLAAHFSHRYFSRSCSNTSRWSECRRHFQNTKPKRSRDIFLQYYFHYTLKRSSDLCTVNILCSQLIINHSLLMASKWAIPIGVGIVKACPIDSNWSTFLKAESMNIDQKQPIDYLWCMLWETMNSRIRVVLCYNQCKRVCGTSPLSTHVFSCGYEPQTHEDLFTSPLVQRLRNYL